MVRFCNFCGAQVEGDLRYCSKEHRFAAANERRRVKAAAARQKGHCPTCRRKYVTPAYTRVGPPGEGS